MQWAAAALLGMAIFLIIDQSQWWMRREDYSFGFLVPIFVGYILYERWPKMKLLLLGEQAGQKGTEKRSEEGPESSSPEARGRLGTFLTAIVAGCVVAAGLGMFALGAAYKAAEGSNLSATMAFSLGFGACVLGFAYLFSEHGAGGRKLTWKERITFAGWFLFPALIWILSAPMFNFLEKAVSTFLLNKVTVVVFYTFDFLGLALHREGSILILPGGDQVGVEDACSGIRSLMACLFAGSFLGAVFLNKLWKKIALVGCAMAFAFAMNLVRSLFLTAWAYTYGSEAIAGFVHDATGYAVLGVTVVGLLILLPIFNFRWEYEPEEDTGDPDEAQAAPS